MLKLGVHVGDNPLHPSLEKQVCTFFNEGGEVSQIYICQTDQFVLILVFLKVPLIIKAKHIV